MKNKWFKRFGIAIGILLLIILVVNFGINFWLKHQLPDYLKKNTNYIITYQNLDVDVGTGNIFSTNISINNKQPNNTKIVRLQGTIDTLKINKVGIIHYLITKEISTDYIFLAKPSLKVILAEQKNKTNKKEKLPINAEQIEIRNGNIDILKSNQEVLFSVNKFFLNVEGLEVEEQQDNQILPFSFDRYQIKGNNIFLRLSDYGLSIQDVSTNDNQTQIKNFQLKPLFSNIDFQKRNPHQLNIFDVKIADISLKEILLKDKKLNLSNAVFNQSEVTIFKTKANAQKKNKEEVKNEINIQEVISKNAKVRIFNADQQEFLNTGVFDLNVQKILYDKNTAISPIPFIYEKFDIKGSQAAFNNGTQNINVLAYAINDLSGEFRKISLKSTAQTSQKQAGKMDIERIHYLLNDWKFIDQKLKLDVKNVLIEDANGTIVAKNNQSNKSQNNYKGLSLPLVVHNVEVKNSNITFDKGQQPLTLNKLNARFSKIELNENASKNKAQFNVGEYFMNSENFSYRTKFYQISVGEMTMNKKEMKLIHFHLKPLYSRAQYVRMIPKEKDLYTISANQILMNGNWNLLSTNAFIDATNLKIDGLHANIFRSKIPADDVSIKPLYSAQLRKVKLPMYIANVDIVNSVLEYEEDTPKSDGPGKLTFNQFSLNAKNINSGKTKGKPTEIPIKVQCKFFNVSPMEVQWKMNTALQNDNFTISGHFSDLPASRVNMFVEPYLKIRTSGLIQQMMFDFKGNNHGISGNMKMKHQDFKVSILKQDGEKNKVLSSVANIFVKSNSDQYPESAIVQGVKRDPAKSFFNLFWKGIEEGLAINLTGKSIVNTKSKVSEVKGTAKEVKVAVKDATKAIGEKVQNVTNNASPAQEKKDNAFKKLFKKKEKQKTEE